MGGWGALLVVIFVKEFPKALNDTLSMFFREVLLNPSLLEPGSR